MDPKIKLKAVLDHREGKKSLLDISKEINVSREQIRRWVHKYESLGKEGLKILIMHHVCYKFIRNELNKENIFQTF